MECRVMMSPAPSPEQAAARDKIDPDHCTLDECVRDFSKIDELLMPLFKDEKGQLPVYFDDLSSDLRTKSVVAALWSKENFNYHPAVMPSPARRTLTGGIHYSARAFKLSTDGRYKRLLEECPFDEDWRYTPMIEDDPIMSGVYWFENANKDRDLDEYENTVISALGMQRQVHHHGYQQLEGQALDDYDEGELYTAVKMPGVLTRIFKELLKLNGMGGKQGWKQSAMNITVLVLLGEAGSKDLLLKD
ncbi:uncharacterized protein LOC125509419 isoform X2 [Triticum urartu]|uniref:uncharacterized protein LOC125509419 isoform X2 n=1 Tax=Triticum urartu TaxID=4572 RepID=UPI00204430B9|nr:uncharacterized protein LOC125509419 isoform X2 [Triticum urartu]